MSKEMTLAQDERIEPLAVAREADVTSQAEEVICGRYRVVRPLGTGGMGTVYLVLDRHRNYAPLALKRVVRRSVNRKVLGILRREFLTLAPLRHPNLPRVYDFGVEPSTGDVFFTAEYVNGVDWRQAVAGLDLGSRRDLELFIDLLAQVLRALGFIHGLGRVHGDMKPANILVASSALDEGSPPRLQAKVIDFGLTKRERCYSGRRVLGTPYYVAPETITGARVDRRTDIYSLGVLLYELTTGQVPFRGGSNLTVLQSHLGARPTAPGDLAGAIPPALSRTIERCLEKAPEDRFQTVYEILDELRREIDPKVELETLETTSAYVERGRLVGNERRLSGLCSVLRHACRRPRSVDASTEEVVTSAPAVRRWGRARGAVRRGRRLGHRVVLIQGAEGTGRRQLVRAARSELQTRGITFLETECDPAARVAGASSASPPEMTAAKPPNPQQATGGLPALVRHLNQYEGVSEGGMGPDYLRLAAGIAFELGTCNHAQLTSEHEMQLRSVISGLLDATRERALVLQFHDVHRMDDALSFFFRELCVSLASRPAESRLVVCATLPDEAELPEEEVSAPAWRSLAELAVHEKTFSLHLENLDVAAVRRLLRIVFHGCHFPDTFVQRLAEETDGNPAKVETTLRGLASEGRLRRTVSTWVLRGDSREGALPGGRREQLRQEISSLPAEAFDLGAAFACVGRACGLDLALALSGLSAAAARLPLSVLVRRKILRWRQESIVAGESGARYDFVSPSLRDVFYEEIPMEQRRFLHGCCGSLCEGGGAFASRLEPEELARHYLLAGDHLKGVHFGLEAARLLGQRFLPRRAMRLYDQVLRATASADGSPGSALEGDEPSSGSLLGLGAAVTREIAKLRFQLGDYRGAEQLLDNIDESELQAASPQARFLILLQAARVQTRLGRLERAEVLVARAMDCVPSGEDSKEADGNRFALLFTYAELLQHKGEIDESLRGANRLLDVVEQAPGPVLQCDLYLLLADNHAAIHSREAAASYCKRALDVLAAREDNPHLLALRFFFRGRYLKHKYRFQKAVGQFQLCRILWRKIGAEDLEASALLELGELYGALGRPRRARRALRRSLALFHQSGNVRKEVEAKCVLGEIFSQIGEHDSSHELLSETESSEAVARVPGLRARIRWTFARACMDLGDLENAGRYLYEAESLAQEASERSVVAARVPLLQSLLAWQRGEYTLALEGAKRGLRLARELRDPRVYVELLYQKALVQCHLGAVGPARRTLRSLRRRARRHGFVATEGLAWLLSGRLRARQGDIAGAEQALARARRRLESAGGERDRLEFHLEAGRVAVAAGKLEEGGFHYEEGDYLVRRLNFLYFKGAYVVARAELESKVDSASPKRLEEQLRYAHRIAVSAGYRELELQASEKLSAFYRLHGDSANATTMTAEVEAIRQALLQDMPERYRGAFQRGFESLRPPR